MGDGRAYLARHTRQDRAELPCIAAAQGTIGWRERLDMTPPTVGRRKDAGSKSHEMGLGLQAPVASLECLLVAVYQALQRVGRIGVLGDPCSEGLNDIMLANRPTGANLVDRLAPPLEPDCAESRFTDHKAHPCQFHIQGIERNQAAPGLARRIPRGYPAILVSSGKPRIKAVPIFLAGRTGRREHKHHMARIGLNLKIKLLQGA